MNMDREKIQQEVDENYRFFQAHKREIGVENLDKFVLMRDKEFVGFYSTKEDAVTAGRSQFADRVFSVQKVSDDVVDLGSVAYALF